MAIDVMGLESKNPQSAPLKFAVLNRGEAAVRFMRTAKVWARTHERQVETVAFYTDPDAAMPFVRMADHAVHLGDAFTTTPEGARVSSYLDVARLVELCQQHGVTAVWPGWGFLGESAELSEALADVGIVFFGPSAEVMRLLADKIASKKFAEQHDVPVSPWSQKEVDSVEEALALAPSIGFPLITKAAAGGGGRGIRLVHEIEELEAAFRSAGAEALSAFGDAALFLEAYVDRARHVEVQILADTHGTVWSLGTRDCSVQRRHQKVLEEAPAPMLADGVEDQICAAARRLAAACGYQGAGTAEFLLLPDGHTFYFLEMNARLQVEHTVTETLFGFDIVGAQIDVAFGTRLHPEPPARRGAAIEARLNAEEPDMGFAPAGGKISTFDLPGGPGVRVDSGFRAGDHVSGAFDSNLAKIIAWGRDRREAIARLEQALRDTRVAVEGGLTNRAMILEVLADADFLQMRHSTRWLDHYIERRPSAGRRPHLVPSLIAAALVDAAAARKEDRAALFAHVHAGPPQRLNSSEPRSMRYLVDGQPVEASVAQLAPGRFAVRAGEARALIDVEWVAPDSITFVVDDERYSSLIARSTGWIQVNTRDISHRFERVPDGRIVAEMSAVVTSLAVEPGQTVERGDRLLTLEVMKMEIHLDAPMAGTVEAIHVGPATQVTPGEPLLEMRPIEQGNKDEEAAVAEPIRWHRAPRDPDTAAVLRAGVLGYEVTEREFNAALDRLAAHNEEVAAGVVLDALEALVISRALFLEGPHDDAANDSGESSAAQTFWFLQNRRLDEERLSPLVARRIERMLALHGVSDLNRKRAVESALFRLFQTRLREIKRQRAVSIFLDALLQRWSRGALHQDETERALGLLDGLGRFTTLTGAHELTLRVGHLGHRLRGFSDEPTRQGAFEGEAHPLLDAALAHTITLRDFELRALPRALYQGARSALAVARDDESDRRVLTVAALTAFEPAERGGAWTCPHTEAALRDSIDALRQTLLDHDYEGPWRWNRITLIVPEALEVDPEAMERVVGALDTSQLEALEVEKLVVMHAPDDEGAGFKVEMIPSHAWNGQATVSLMTIGDTQMANLSDADRRVMRARRRRQLTPEQIIEAVRETEAHGVRGPGSFVEYDLDAKGHFGPRAEGAPRREANLIVGLMTHPHERWASGLERVFLLGDVTRTMGSLAEAECRRVIAALDLAEERGVPVEWISFSSGARIAFDSGTENLDWTARVLRRIIEFTQDGGTIHVLVDGPCVGAQSYWNAEATMLNHCRGALFMTPRGYMILTGKRALEHSGCVSGASNEAIGGLGIMAPNGEAQYVAATLADAYEMLLRHYALTYVEPGSTYTARVSAADPCERDLTGEPYLAKEGGFATLGEIFSDKTNAGRKRPFDIRAVMGATLDADVEPLERWAGVEGGESAVVFHGQLGGQPVCMIGIESMPIARKGVSPTHGPSSWTSGTLYPESSRKVARAIHAASGVQPVVVLANLSGFDGSPESLRNRQLEYGAEIGRAVVNFRGPILFCVISRYHGGAYVVFSRGLNENLEALALQGSFASVIGGGPAAAVVFPREVKKRTDADPRVVQARAKRDAGQMSALDFDKLRRTVHTETQAAVAREFDQIHSVERAKSVGSLDDIIAPATLRATLCARTEAAVTAWRASSL